MTSQAKPPRNIAIVPHLGIPGAGEFTQELTSFLTDQGISVYEATLTEETLREKASAGEFDMLLAVGGDGTMLRAGHLCGPCQLPIFGINMGKLGFLYETNRGNWKPMLERVLKGDYWLESRMMLRAEHLRGENLLGAWDVVNECVIGRGEIMRPVHLTAVIDGRRLTTYVADGLIISTPTGSTAYALAAGGPILPPELRNILLVPVAPHLSVDRAIVLHEGSLVQITVNTDHRAALSVDGQLPVPMKDGDSVEAKANQHVVEFVRLQDPDYFYRNLTSRMNQNPSVGANE